MHNYIHPTQRTQNYNSFQHNWFAGVSSIPCSPYLINICLVNRPKVIENQQGIGIVNTYVLSHTNKLVNFCFSGQLNFRLIQNHYVYAAKVKILPHPWTSTLSTLVHRCWNQLSFMWEIWKFRHFKHDYFYVVLDAMEVVVSTKAKIEEWFKKQMIMSLCVKGKWAASLYSFCKPPSFNISCQWSAATIPIWAGLPQDTTKLRAHHRLAYRCKRKAWTKRKSLE